MARRRENREFLRRDCLMLCSCEGQHFRSKGHIVDISHGGAGIVGTKNLPAENDRMLVKILLPGSSFELPSRVVWTESKAKKLGPADFGVEFLDKLSDRQSKLSRFLIQRNAVED